MAEEENVTSPTESPNLWLCLLSSALLSSHLDSKLSLCLLTWTGEFKMPSECSFSTETKQEILHSFPLLSHFFFLPSFCPLSPTYPFHLFSTCLTLLIHQTQPRHLLARLESNFGQKQKALESLVIRFRSSYWALVRLLNDQQSFQATTLEIENLLEHP